MTLGSNTIFLTPSVTVLCCPFLEEMLRNGCSATKEYRLNKVVIITLQDHPDITIIYRLKFF